MSDLPTQQAELEYSSIVLAQGALEQDSVDQGLRRYTDELRKQGATGKRPGLIGAEKCIQPLADAIRAFTADELSPGRRKVIAMRYLIHFEPEQAAYITARFAIDGAAAYSKINTVAIAIGTALEDHLRLVWMHEDAPALYRKAMEQVKRATTGRHRSQVLRHVAKKYAARKLKWGNRDKLLLGVKLIELFDESCGLIQKQMQTTGKHNTPIHLTFTEAAQQSFDAENHNAALMAPVHQPMVVEPRDWTSLHEGGYLTRAIWREVAQTHSKESRKALKEAISAGQLCEVFDAINTVQRTPWRVNTGVLSVMQEAAASGERYQALLAEPDAPLPARPAGLPPKGTALTLEQKEALQVWKIDAAMIHDHNARLRSQRIASARARQLATKFADYPAVYFPHYIDFRGRIYPFASYLNPQANDLGRSLLEFAEGKPLGERGLYWLKVHLANLFGVDKVSFADRVKWVNDHLEEILDSAASPLDGQMFWTTADNGQNAWCALAACMEIAGALVAGSDFVSHIPIAMDGSCSGLQHYSAMLRDPIGGAAVNLVPAAKPGDIYTQVANKAQVLSDSLTGEMSDAWRGKVVRKVAKQPTMTLCYSATVFGMGSQIEKAVAKMGGAEYLGTARVRPAAVYLARVIWDAIGETVVAARDGMAFLREVAEQMTEHQLPIRWTTPVGLPVEQSYKEIVGQHIKLHYKGHRIDLSIAVDSKRLDEGEQSSGIAPNFIHSLDSAHLMSTVNLASTNGLHHWACIHDSFGVHAADVDTLHACIREAFIEQYTPNVLERFREEIVSQLPPEFVEKIPAVPVQGTLELAAVRESSYFFA